MRCAGLIALLLLTGPVWAGSSDGVSGQSEEPGDETRAWLDLQRSGRAAAPDRPIPGPVASRIYKRYLESFEHPIPAQFDRESGMPSTR